MEDILALLLIFGGGTLIAISFSPVRKAIADRIRGHTSERDTDPAVYEELERMRGEMAELQERVDFTERLLARSRDQAQLPEGQ
ncbi:MAG TPA: hypothetical protein VG692_16720 [Gemmatimonadales bacterium]|nr:hypothetical protein [Gemmatimonadales bacterium]